MKLEGVILAAGLSSRAGTHKMMLDIGGKTVIERCVESMADSCDRIVVVGGYKIENIRALLEKYNKVDLVYNKSYMDGMFSSVKTGLEHISGDRFFLTPGDYPLIKKETYREIADEEGDIVIPRYEGAKGHPILIDSRFIDEIVSSDDYSSLRDFIGKVGFKAVDTNDRGILMDVDTIDDYEAILKATNDGCFL